MFVSVYILCVWFLRRITEVKNTGIYLIFTVAMVTKMGDKIGLTQRNCTFGPNLRLWETYFLRIKYQHS